MTIFQFKSRDAVPSVPVPDADSGSIVNAQVQDPRPPRMEAAARAPNTAFRAETDEDALPVKVGPDLPEVEMPDPLPTSPFLKRV